ncbi:MAG TPA: hypothetical protein VGH19_07720 [Verrucomicrobiae bacterium]
MKSFVWGLLVAVGMVVGGDLHAQFQPQQALKVQIFTERQQFLTQEPMQVSVRVYNYTGEALILGQEADWISFSVEPMANKSIVRQVSEPEVAVPAFAVNTGEMATRRVNLVPHFEIVKSGRYKITATVKCGRWGEKSSEPLMVDVVSGTPLWVREFGVPGPNGVESELRKYQVVQTRHMDASQLYIKVTDAYDSKVYGVHHLGQMVIEHKTEQQTDRNNRLHVLHRSGRSFFTYSMVDYDGRIILRQRYEQDGIRPGLQPTASGEVLVSGGVRTRVASDIDPLADELEAEKKRQQQQQQTQAP